MQVTDTAESKRPVAVDASKSILQIDDPDDDFDDVDDDLDDDLDDDDNDDDLDDDLDDDDNDDDLDDSVEKDKVLAALSPGRLDIAETPRCVTSPWVSQQSPPRASRKHGKKRRGPDGKPLKLMPLALSVRDYDRVTYAMAMRTSSLFRRTYGGNTCAQPTDDVSRGTAIAEICEAWAEMVAEKR